MELLNSFEKKIPGNPNDIDMKENNTNSTSQNDLRFLPKTLLIVDTETTGLDPQKDYCLELGSILFHVESRSVLAQHSFLIPVERNDAEYINQIPAEITQLNQPWKEGLQYFELLLNASDALLAHNAAFDRQWFGKSSLPVISKPWICSMEDISWPTKKQLSNRPSVRDLALAYGVPVWNAHRALTDCIYLSEVLQRCESLQEVLMRALEPRRLMRAQVSYEDRHLAKKAGFRWNDPVRGAWTRRLSDREIQDLNFTVVSVELEND
tara:strand:- start:3447 stop:4244 length:798 start_codon:yes stop_codon:yes gene_type:complete